MSFLDWCPDGTSAVLRTEASCFHRFQSQSPPGSSSSINDRVSDRLIQLSARTQISVFPELSNYSFEPLLHITRGSSAQFFPKSHSSQFLWSTAHIYYETWQILCTNVNRHWCQKRTETITDSSRSHVCFCTKASPAGLKYFQSRLSLSTSTGFNWLSVERFSGYIAVAKCLLSTKQIFCLASSL